MMSIFLIMLEFVFIILLQALGIGFHVMQSVISYDKQFKDLSKGQIFTTFWDEDWTTVLISVLVLVFDVATHAIIHIWFPHLTEIIFWGLPFLAWSFIAAFVLGYAGQAILYKWLGTAKSKLIQMADKIENKPV